ncbi:MAG: YggT family protein [Chromatiales bacterium]|nr:YggT family protein [Chromatiales bacterium]
MGNNYFSDPVVFLIQVIFGTYALVVLLRFLLQLFHADFHNPVSQFVVKVTSPVLKPLRRIVPGIGGMDIASLVLAWLVKSLELGLILVVTGTGAHFISAFFWSLPELLGLAINVFLIAILIQVILSWVGTGGYNPAASLLYSLTEPLLRPARRIVPVIGGLDISPMLVMIGLVLLKMLLLPPLQMLVGSPFL